MLPISMAAQHRHLAGALAKIVSQSDNVDDLTTFLEGLGRDHRKFGVVAEHYDAGAPEPAGGLGTFPGAGLDERSVYFLARLSRATRPWKCGSLTSASMPAPRRWPPRRGRGSPGQEAVHRAGRRCAGPPLPPSRSCLPRAHRARRHRDDHRAAAPARGPGDRSRPPAGPVHQRRIHARVHHRARPRDAVGYEPARPRPPTARAGPGGSAMAVRESPGKPVRVPRRSGRDPARDRAGRRSGPRRWVGLDPATAAELNAGWAGAAVAAGAAAGGEGDPRDDPRRDGQHGSDQRSHGAAAPGPGLSTP